ncbi:MAG: DUF5752 family protein [Candidatus Omnitrophota bacterium]
MEQFMTKEPFVFYSRLNLRELTGERVYDLKGLLHALEQVPGAVIYHHTHHFLAQHLYLSPEPPNDFAYWVDEILNEHKLAEELASIDTVQCSSIRQLREKIILTIANYLRTTTRNPQAPEGQEFYFIKTITFIMPTGYIAHNLEEFNRILSDITVQSIYFHIFEARMRLEKDENDFSFWIRTNIGDNDLANEISKLDPYTYTIEGLRARMLKMIKNRLG